MKKVLKIFLIAVLFLLILLIIIPLAFRGRIIEIAKAEINKNLNARVEFADLRLSLIRNFPNLSVTLTDLSVVGTDVFQYDTLVSMNSFRTVVDIKSVFGDAIQVRSVSLDRPRVKALVLEDGRANWDIMIETDDVPAEPAEDEFEFLVQMHKFEVRRGFVEYMDIPLEVRTTIDNLNLTMHGDLTQNFTSLDISAVSDIFNFWYEDFRYISDARLSVNTLLDADLDDFRFTFSESEVMLNALEMGVDGFFAMPDEGMEMDINFFSKKTDFKTVLSLVPAVYRTDFEGLQASGSLGLEGFIRGVMKDDIFPSMGMGLIVENGGISYPDLPESIENIQMNLNLYYDGVDEDKTTVDLRNFSMEMAGNPFRMALSIRTPASDMAVDALVNGTIDFTSLEDVLPLEDVILRGLLESDAFFSGRMSDIENERYQELNTGGSMRLTAFQYADAELPYSISIPGAELTFSPRFIELTGFESVIGNSDLRMAGRIENFIPYMFNDGILKGNMTFSSSLLDLNELLAGETETDTVALSLVEIPGNIDITLDSSADKVIFDNLEISNLQGRVAIRDQSVVMDPVNMNMLEGSINMRGEYNTRDMGVPFIDFSINIIDFDIPSSFHAFNTVERIAPIAKGLRGTYSTDFQMHAILDDEMMPVLNTLDATGRLRTSQVELVSSETFGRLSSALRLREDRDNVLRDVDFSFTIKDGRVHIEPFNMRMGPVNMVIGGDQGIDQTLNYVARLTVPRSAFGSGADQLIDNLASRAAERGLNIQPGDNVNIDARITGTFTDPSISLDMRESARTAVDQVREQIREQATEEIERRVEQAEERAREEVSERAAQIIREAERRADQVRSAAEDAAERIRKEAETNAARIEQQAAGRGRIAEAAAKRTAESIRREAADKADALVREADQKATRIIEEAKKEAARLQ